MSITGPSKVWKRRVSRCFDPLSPGSTIFSKVFLTGNPTPCSLRSTALFPCQKKVKSFSFKDSDSARCVSFRTAISTFSLSSSLSMTAVFLTSLMFRRSSSPVVMVWMFQHPRLRAGLNFNPFFFLGVLLLGAEIEVCLSDFLIPMHPMRKADRGGKASYWLGTAQLKAGGSCPMRWEISFLPPEPTLAPHSMPIEHCSI